MSVQWKGDEFMARMFGPNGALNRGVTAAAIELESTIREGFGHSHGMTPSKPGAYPNTQFGDLRNSMGHTKASMGVAFVGSGLPYARYLNDGAVIRPGGKALVIPLTYQAKRLLNQYGGSPRRAINALKYGGKKIAFIRTSHGLLVAQSIGGKHARTVGWFLITRKTIVIQPRPWAKLGISQATAAMADRFAATVKEAMA